MAGRLLLGQQVSCPLSQKIGLNHLLEFDHRSCLYLQGLCLSLKYPCVNVALKPTDRAPSGDYLKWFWEYALCNKIKQLCAAEVEFLAYVCVSNNLNMVEIFGCVVMCIHWSSCVLIDPVNPM